MLEKNTVENEEVEIDLVELFGFLLHWIWLIIICGIAAGLVGFLVSAFLLTPKYESTTGIYVMSRQNGDTLSYSDTQLATQLTKDYEELISSRTVLESVIAEESLPDTYETLKGRVDVENTSDTRIIYITVTDTDPSKARCTANAIREAAARHIMSVTEVQAVNTVDEANLPTEPASPSVRKWTGIGGVLGILLCTVILVVRFLLDDTIKTSEDVEKYLGWGTLAVIPTIEENQERRKVSKKTPVRSNKEEGGERQDRDKDSHQPGQENGGIGKQKAKNKKQRDDRNPSAEEPQDAHKRKRQDGKEADKAGNKAKNEGKESAADRQNGQKKDSSEKSVSEEKKKTADIEDIEDIEEIL